MLCAGNSDRPDRAQAYVYAQQTVQDQEPDARLGGVQVIRRAARILEALSGHPEGLSLAQISSSVDLPRSTVHRLIAALDAEGFVVAASPSGRFRLGPALTRLAASADRDIAVQARPYLAELSHELNETVDLAVLRHDRVLFIDQVASPQRLQAVSAIGAAFPAYCTANGKALLATLPAGEVEALFPAQLQPLTPETITDRAALLEQLSKIGPRGTAFDVEEHTIGICAVGVAVSAAGKETIALSVPLPAQRFYGNEKRLAKALLKTRDTLERALGGEFENVTRLDRVAG
jgi:DNA-binding IclR family transcriptional regulator